MSVFEDFEHRYVLLDVVTQHYALNLTDQRFRRFFDLAGLTLFVLLMEGSFLSGDCNTSILRTGFSIGSAVLSTCHQPIASRPRSGLERGDFVQWPTRDEPTSTPKGRL